MGKDECTDKTEYKAIWGYDQEKLCLMGFDPVDLVILDWFLYFKGSDKMACIRGEDKRLYFWVSYNKVLNDLPFLKFKTKKAMFDRFRKLCGLFIGASTELKYPLKKITDVSHPGKHRAMFAVDVDAINAMKKTREVVPAKEEEAPSTKKPVDNSDLKPDFTDEFKDLFNEIMETGNLKKEPLYKKNGEPKITLLRAQKMVEDLLNGDFIEKNEVVLRKTESPDWIKGMTYSKILSVCRKFKPSVSVTLNNFFVLSYGNSKGRSAFIQYCNPSYNTFTPTPSKVQLEDIPQKVQDKVYEISNKFKIEDRISLTTNLMELYAYAVETKEDQRWSNDGNPDMWGSFNCMISTWMDNLSDWKDTKFSPNHFKMHGKTWDWLVKKLETEFNVCWVVDHKKAEKRRIEWENRHG